MKPDDKGHMEQEMEEASRVQVEDQKGVGWEIRCVHSGMGRV